MNFARLVTVLAFSLASFGAPAQAPAEALFNLVTLRADAQREVPNDLLGAVLAAEAEGPDPALLAGEVNRAMQAALTTGKGYRGVTLRSGGYQTLPVYDKGKVVRWRVRQELRLQSTDLPAATELIGKLQATLTVRSMALSVSPEQRRQAENALYAEALAAFEERARLVRDALKAKAYRVRDLDVSGGGGGGPVPVFARAALSAPSAPAVEAGSTLISVAVSGTIQLQ